MCQTFHHLATLLPDPVVATSVLIKSAPSLGVPRDELVGDIHGGCVDGEPVDHPHDLIGRM